MLTARELFLMYAAYEAGYFKAQLEAEAPESGMYIDEAFEEWLDDVIADNGGTVRDYLNWQAQGLMEES